MIEILRPSSIFAVSGYWYNSAPPPLDAAVSMIDEDVLTPDLQWIYSLGPSSRLNVFFPAPSIGIPGHRFTVRLRSMKHATGGDQVTITPYTAVEEAGQTVTLTADWSLQEFAWEGSFSQVTYVQIYQGLGGYICLDAIEVKFYGADEPSYAAHPRPPTAAPTYLTPPVRGWY